MSFFQLVRREMEGSLGRLVFVSAMGGLSTTAIIGAINAGAGAADKGEISLWAAGFFVVALLLFIQTQHFILITTTAEIGAIIHKMRVRLLDYVRRSELLPLETIGRAEIVSAITGDTAILTQASNMLAFAVQGALLIALVTTYVAYLSFTAFVLSVVIVGTGAAIFHSKTKQHATDMREAAGWENKLYDRLSDVLDGFKEVRLNRARSDALFDHLVDVSRTAANIKIRTQSETYRRMVLLADLALYPARLGRVRRADVQHVDDRGLHHQGGDRAGVHRRRLFRARAVDPDHRRGERRRRPARATGGQARRDHQPVG